MHKITNFDYKKLLFPIASYSICIVYTDTYISFSYLWVSFLNSVKVSIVLDLLFSPWKFHKIVSHQLEFQSPKKKTHGIFSWSPLEIPLIFFVEPSNFYILFFFYIPGNSMSSPPSPLIVGTPLIKGGGEVGPSKNWVTWEGTKFFARKGG